MGEDPVYHGVKRALLLEDDTRKVEEDLVPLDLQQTSLIDLGVPQAKAAKLEISFKHMAVMFAEVAIIVFVDDLKMLTLLEPVLTKEYTF